MKCRKQQTKQLPINVPLHRVLMFLRMVFLSETALQFCLQKPKKRILKWKVILFF